MLLSVKSGAKERFEAFFDRLDPGGSGVVMVPAGCFGVGPARAGLTPNDDNCGDEDQASSPPRRVPGALRLSTQCHRSHELEGCPPKKSYRRSILSERGAGKLG